MKNVPTILGHFTGKTILFFYILKEEIKVRAIELFRGEEAKRDYIFSKVEVPVTFYMHQDMISLAKTLAVDSHKWRLFVDIHVLSAGRLDDADIRKITAAYFSKYSKDQTKAERRSITLEYLLLMG